jgi:chaperonin GroEL
MMQYQKVKSVSKAMRSKGPKLQAMVLNTMKTVADMVGATLGPGGQHILIERQEHNLPGVVTKDGVTVFRNLGFDDPTAHVIMEAARDAAVRTVNEAGDGTTTATVLAEAIVRFAHHFIEANRARKVSPQKVVRRLMEIFSKDIEPLILGLTTQADMSTDAGRKLLWNVAKISANGDTQLADAVLNCFDLVGDDGNVTITEISGPSGFEVERIEGYPVPVGYEDSCAKYAPKFINDPAAQRTVLENPVFIVYDGRITEIQTLVDLMERIGSEWQQNNFRHNVVLVTTGYSETVLAQLAMNFAEATTINVFPLLAPLSPVPGGQRGVLEDICAVTGSKLFDPLNNTLPSAARADDLNDAGLGMLAKTFEANRFRSVVIGETAEDGTLHPDAQLLIEEQVAKLQSQAKQAASELDLSYFNERIGKLTGGIAKLKVIGASNGELRERRDRAEDAVCAVRGAIRKGVLPGGGWTLMRVAYELGQRYPSDPVVRDVLAPALLEPVARLFSNVGFVDGEAAPILDEILKGIMAQANGESQATPVYDAYEGKIVDAWDGGILDSTPAVLEAIRNSLSIASLLGTLGGTVVFKRDSELERIEAKETNSFLRDADFPQNPADERAM